MKSILKMNAHSAYERNAFGQTPLHLSALWSERLKVLLQIDGIDIDVMDDGDYTPIAYAIRFMESTSVQLLLDQGCSHVIMHESHKLDILEFFLECLVDDYYEGSCSDIEEIKPNWEEELRFCHSLINGLVQRHARFGYPQSNWNPRRYTISDHTNEMLDFHLHRSKALFEAGFRDICSADASGFTPLICWLLEGWNGILMVDWLLGNGADPLVRDAYGRIALHYVMGASVDAVGQQTHCYIDRIKPILKHGASFLEVRDSCQCACSYKGCTPCSTYFRQNKPLLTCGSHTCKDATYFCRDCIFLSIELNRNDQYSVTKIFCRLQAFEALDITHTCCLRSPPRDLIAERFRLGKLNLSYAVLPPSDYISYLQEEADQIRSEEESLINELDDLMATFDALFSDYVSYNGRNAYGFYDDVWKHEVDKLYVKHGQPISKEDKLKLKEIGVNLHRD